jgi:hypothetical protein
VNLVPTQYWIDDASSKYQPNMCHPDNWAENQKVSYYCSKFEWNSNCEPFNAQNIARFEKGIKTCIQKVRRAGALGRHALQPGPFPASPAAAAKQPPAPAPPAPRPLPCTTPNPFRRTTCSTRC